MSKIGFIGLGIMGKPMVRNLRKAGHELVVYDIFAKSVDEMVGDGRMPKPKKIDGRVVWDRVLLDEKFEALEDQSSTLKPRKWDSL